MTRKKRDVAWDCRKTGAWLAIFAAHLVGAAMAAAVVEIAVGATIRSAAATVVVHAIERYGIQA